jgi:hypothetical protein
MSLFPKCSLLFSVSEVAGPSNQPSHQRREKSPRMVKRDKIRLVVKRPTIKMAGIGKKTRLPKIFLRPNQRSYYFQEVHIATPPRVLVSAADKLWAARYAAKALITSAGWEIWRDSGAYRIFARALKDVGVKKALLKRYVKEKKNSPRIVEISPAREATPVQNNVNIANVAPAAAGEFLEVEAPAVGLSTPENQGSLVMRASPTRRRLRKRLFSNSHRIQITPQRLRQAMNLSPMGAAIRDLREVMDRFATTTPPQKTPSPAPTGSTTSTPETPAAGHKSPGPGGRWVRHRRSPIFRDEAPTPTLAQSPTYTPDQTPVRTPVYTPISSVASTLPPTPEVISLDETDDELLLDSEEEGDNPPEWSPLSSYARTLVSPDYRPITPDEDEESEENRMNMKRKADEEIQVACQREKIRVLADLVISRRYLTNAICGLNHANNRGNRRQLEEILANLQGSLTEIKNSVEQEVITLDD